ncbi:non-homologous end-joining DNA ligase [Maribacter aestuarii]|uniref:non-homologous end-joining DNA ligase n=1 Tax=Maribacter aestuarii TaxID=1130723 RepID=UPI0025A4E78E|nr:non-homologous end-joining DNA ligase [Maribacter aestuarii]
MISLEKKRHSEKILFPKSGITKGQLIRYYEAIAAYMLPYLKDRPLTLHRFPDGIGKKGFFQKNAADYFPQWIKTMKIKKEGGWVNHVICDSEETLLYLVGQGTITFHVTLSKTDKLDYPDKLIFDLDPPNGSFEHVTESAQILRSLLESELGLTTYPMLTGSSGIHLVVPLDRSENFDGVRDFAKKIARYIAKEHSGLFTAEIRKDQRKGRLFVDYLRNSYAQTAVCPFSVRAFENAPVAVPIGWNELQNGIQSARAYTIVTLLHRVEHVSDPWKDFGKKTIIWAMLNPNWKN